MKPGKQKERLREKSVPPLIRPSPSHSDDAHVKPKAGETLRRPPRFPSRVSESLYSHPSQKQEGQEGNGDKEVNTRTDHVRIRNDRLQLENGTVRRSPGVEERPGSI